MDLEGWMGFQVVNMREGDGGGGESTDAERGVRAGPDYRVYLEHRMAAGELLEISLERLAGARAWRSQILRGGEPLKLFVPEKT